MVKVSAALIATAMVYCVGGAFEAGAQSVLLQIRPRVGDTLHVRLEQQVEMTGMPSGCGGPQNALRARPKNAPGNCADTRTMITRMQVYSRAVARNVMRDATDMIAITDSVLTSSQKRGPLRHAARPLAQRAPAELRVATDGGVELGPGPQSDEMRTLFGQMPATLSRKPVAPGDKWTHEMRIPLAREPGATGLVRTTFQLDSLGSGGQVAYITMRGVLAHDHSDGTDSETSGSLTGTMQFDRRLGWVTETDATINVWSEVRSPSAPPMQVNTKVVQSLRASVGR